MQFVFIVNLEREEIPDRSNKKSWSWKFFEKASKFNKIDQKKDFKNKAKEIKSNVRMAENNRKPTVIMRFFSSHFSISFYHSLSLAVYLYRKWFLSVQILDQFKSNIRVITQRKAELPINVYLRIFQVLKLTEAD